MSELKPCPFCGDQAFLKRNEPYYIIGRKVESVTIYCHDNNCDFEIIYNTEDQAIRKWNNRPYERKVGADAILEASKACNKGDEYGHFLCSVYDLEEYAAKLGSEI